MNFSIGDNVTFKDGIGRGKVVELTSRLKVKIQDEHGFEQIVFAEQLILDNVVDYNKHKPPRPKDQQKNHSLTPKKQRKGVVDLHIYDTKKVPYGMHFLAYQMNQFEAELKKALAGTDKKIIFIHGKGEGILKDAIVEKLQMNYPQLTYKDADYIKYKEGAIEIDLYRKRDKSINIF